MSRRKEAIRDKQFNMRLYEREQRKLIDIAVWLTIKRQHPVSTSEALRFLIDEFEIKKEKP